METYTKIDEDTIKITVTEIVDGVDLKNERIEQKSDLEKQRDEADVALAQAKGRVEEINALIGILDAKLTKLI